MERLRWTLVLAAALAALTSWILPATARAQACCSASSAGEAGVVGRCHFAMVSSALELSHGLGTIDTDGAFQPYRSSSSTDGILSLAAGIRPFDRRFRVGAVVPLHLQHRGAPDLSSAAVRAGDVAWSSGFYLLQDPMIGLDSFIPFLEPFLAGTIPTGIHPGESTDPLGADTTSQGAASLGGGLKTIKFLSLAHALRLSGEVRYFFAHEVAVGRNTVAIRPAPAYTLTLGYTYERNIFWSMGALVRATFQGNRRLGDAAIPDSDSRRVYTGLTFRRSIRFPFWDFTASAGQDMLLGENQGRAGLSLTLGVQRNFL